MGEAGSTGGKLRHLALLYRDADTCAAAVREFAAAADASAQPVLIAVPGARQALLRAAVEPLGCEHLTFTDLCDLGRNPARILPAVQSFLDSHPARPVLVVTEPVWPGRSVAEAREAIRHEALVNLAFAGADVTMLCLYDTVALPAEVLADACLTHPALAGHGGQERNLQFAGAGVMPADCDLPLPPVPPDASVLAYRDNLREVRDLIAAHARKAELPEPRAVDLVLAVSEIAANTLRHTDAGGRVSVWHTESELVCQLHDSGHISDPLAGRRPPDPDHPGGHGLWLVHQVCDLVQVRTDQTGTRVRLHMRLDHVTQHAQHATGLGRFAEPSPDPCLS